MVRQCFICKTCDYQEKGANLSFHRFPKDANIRSIWMSLLGLNSDNPVPKRAEICSQHFESNDFVFGSDGRKILKTGAVPLPIHSAFESASGEFSSSSSTSSIISEATTSVALGQQPKMNIINPEEAYLQGDNVFLQSVSVEGSPVRKPIKLEDEVIDIPQAKSHDFDEIPGPSRSDGRDVNEQHKLVPISPSSSPETLTASEVGEQLDEPQMPVKSLRDILKKKRKIRYAGDLSSEDFGTPRKAKENFYIMKKALGSQRRKIKSLQSTVCYLRNRILSSNSLLKYLKEKNFIKESSENILQQRWDEEELSGPTRQRNLMSTPEPEEGSSAEIEILPEYISSAEIKILTEESSSAEIIEILPEEGSSAELEILPNLSSDFDNDEDSPRIRYLEKKIVTLTTKDIIKSAKIRQLQKVIWKQKKRIDSLKQMTMALKKTGLITKKCQRKC